MQSTEQPQPVEYLETTPQKKKEGNVILKGSSSEKSSSLPLNQNVVESPVRESSDMTSADQSEDASMLALGISMMSPPDTPGLSPRYEEAQDDEVNILGDLRYDIVPNPDADEVDLSVLRGTRAPTTAAEKMRTLNDRESEEDLEGLAELLPGLKNLAIDHDDTDGGGLLGELEQDSSENETHASGEILADDEKSPQKPSEPNEESMNHLKDDEKPKLGDERHISMTAKMGSMPHIENISSLLVQESGDDSEESVEATPLEPMEPLPEHKADKETDSSMKEDSHPKADDSSGVSDINNSLKVEDEVGNKRSEKAEQKLGELKINANDSGSSSDHGGSSDDVNSTSSDGRGEKNITTEAASTLEIKSSNADDLRRLSSAGSFGTATQTHEVRMPMYLPTFKPATGCTNASDFIVRCFVARLRSGITVVKHGRSRWCKSRLRILHVHSDGRSLSWKPALGEPTSSKRPPKLDLSSCEEVRHAWSPDPTNPMFTGTPILRQKCEAANAHKSFALIFPKRTVDITAVTADQCKVLMEGFSALCFRLQVANLAGRGGKKVPGSEEEDRSTASVTNTNKSRSDSPGHANDFRMKTNFH